MPRVKEAERLKAAAKVRAYLARHGVGDPASRGLSLEAVAHGAGISRTPLSDPDCPIMTGVRAEIAAAMGVGRLTGQAMLTAEALTRLRRVVTLSRLMQGQLYLPA